MGVSAEVTPDRGSRASAPRTAYSGSLGRRPHRLQHVSGRLPEIYSRLAIPGQSAPCMGDSVNTYRLDLRENRQLAVLSPRALRLQSPK